jgi:hypothetical protein
VRAIAEETDSSGRSPSSLDARASGRSLQNPVPGVDLSVVPTHNRLGRSRPACRQSGSDPVSRRFPADPLGRHRPLPIGAEAPPGPVRLSPVRRVLRAGRSHRSGVRPPGPPPRSEDLDLVAGRTGRPLGLTPRSRSLSEAVTRLAEASRATSPLRGPEPPSRKQQRRYPTTTASTQGASCFSRVLHCFRARPESPHIPPHRLSELHPCGFRHLGRVGCFHDR